MIKRIIHLADIHIRNNQYHDVYQKQFDKLYHEIQKLNFLKEETRIVIVGDIFHQKINISNEQLIIVSSFLNKLSEYGKVIIIPGNHDFLENNLQRLDSITPVIELLNKKEIVYYKNGGVYKDENINWVVYSLYEHNQKPIFEKNEDNLYVGLFHGPIQGFSTDTGYLFEDAYDKINFNDCDIVLCGDIHKRAILKSNDKTPIIMIGSFLQQDFGESINNHGFGVLNVENKDYIFFDIDNDSPFYHFEINDINDIENETEKLLNVG